VKQEQRWITISAAARRLACSAASIRAMIDRGELSTFTSPATGRTKVSAEELDRLEAAALRPGRLVAS
jgi:hypothetical protein